MNNKTIKNQEALLSAPVASTLKNMTIPMIYGMVLLMTFNLIDTFFVSLLGTQPLAAISFTFPITFTILSLTIGLGIGTSAVVAKFLGKGEQELAKNAATAAIYLSAVIVGLLAFIGYLYIDEIFLLLGASPSLLPLIHDYMDIWFFGSVFLVAPMIGNAILRASGDTKTPSIIMGSSGLINAILDPILIFGIGPIPAMGIEGAAIATLLSWALGLFFIIYILMIKRKLIHTKLVKLEKLVNASRDILHIGLPAAGSSMLTPLAGAVMTAIAASFGETTVAAFGVGSRIESIACLVILAMSMSLPPFISQNFGAAKMHRVEEAYKTAIKFVLIWQVGVFVLLLATAPWIAQAFSKEQAVAEVIELFLYILPLGYGCVGVIILTNSSLNALHKPIAGLALNIVRLFVFTVPISYLGSLLYGLHGFFIGALLGNIIMASVAYCFFVKQFNQQVIETKAA